MAAAMGQLADNAALIIDLRHTPGGEQDGVAWIASYFFDKRTHLNDLQSRNGTHTQQFWTHDKLPGKIFGQRKPVYILTSPHTCSGAEEFSYDLQSQKRATIVGEPSCGGAHNGRFRPLNARFYAFVPTARPVNPVTGTNWERVGVRPDVAAPATHALLLAQKLAAQTLVASEQDPQKLQTLRDRISALDTQLQAPVDAARN